MSHPTNPTTQTIEITISPSGQSVVQTRGFSGPSCRDASKFVEQALGQRSAETLTPEFYQPVANQQQAKLQ